MAAFRIALECGAGIECDVRLTADGQVVVFHDHDLRRLCASALAVEASSAAVLMNQRLFDTGERIPLLADLLGLVAGKAPLLVEMKCRGGNAQRIAEAVAHQVNGYPGPLGVMSFEPAAIQWLSRQRPTIRRGLVISERATAFDRWRGMKKSAPDFLAVEWAALERSWVARERSRRRVYSWTIRTNEQRKTAEIGADALIWEGDGRP